MARPLNRRNEGNVASEYWVLLDDLPPDIWARTNRSPRCSRQALLLTEMIAAVLHKKQEVGWAGKIRAENLCPFVFLLTIINGGWATGSNKRFFAECRSMCEL